MSVIPQDILDTEYLGQEKEVNKIEPLVSVVTTTYNQEKYIGECLDSILMQKTNFPVELIIGEDGSSDLTREICMEYADRNPDKIRLFLRTPKQKMEVRGRKTFHYNFFNSIKNSRGRYCAICEGDDFWTDVNKLQYQVDFLERNEQFSLHYHQCEVVNEGMTNKRSYQSVQEPKSFRLEHTLHKKQGITLSIMFRKHEVDFDEFESLIRVCDVGDWPLELSLLHHGRMGYLDPRQMGTYRRNPGGVTVSEKTNRIRFLESRLDVMSRLKEISSEKEKEMIDRILGLIELELLLNRPRSIGKTLQGVSQLGRYYLSGNSDLKRSDLHFTARKIVNRMAHRLKRKYT